MSEWKTIAAEEYCDSVRDGTHDTPKQVDKGYKLVTAKHINNGQIDLSDAYLISEKDYIKICERSKVEKWDVLMSMIGNGLGKSAVVKDNPEYAIKNLALFKIGDEMRAKWLHYYLSSKSGQGYIYNSLQGSGQPFISLFVLRKFPIPILEDESTMRDIVNNLSRYDSLIENYQKQIKLLEEAAQRLYKEWFVDLRFPGYENTKIVDGVPEGWKKGVLNDIAYESGKKVDKKNRDYYNYYLPIDCLPKHSLTYLTPANISLAESSLVSFEENDIIFGAMRPYFHKVCFAQSNGLTRTTCFVLNSKENEYREYLLMLLFEDSTVKHATSISVGTTMPYTRWKEFKSMEIIIPAKEIAVVFGKQISRITNVLNKLSSQIRLLIEARDRLLPKLMGGEIEV